ncbi:urea amidolyase associated protein UAAP1 [Phenylobacterium sp.]|uniref:urea amidolyase associated protein UAAP1 n=1 Tax=Phenylobacterium sp. TaxID=1871053 RepID=UPI0035B23119
MSGTADPYGAQAHARAQAGTKVESMPTLPASAAPDVPDGVAAADMLWAETIAPGGYAAKRLNRGARLRLIDKAGEACLSMLVFNAERPVERLNVADTVKVQWNAYLGAGRLLLSDMGKVLFSILEDTAGTHDAFCGASNAASNARRYGTGDNWGPHPNGRDRFKLGVAKFGLGARDIHPCINWFKGVRIEPDGAATLNYGPFEPGRQVTLRAEMDVVLVLANCPHVLDPRADYTSAPARVLAWRGAPTAEDDPIRNATPEGLRAFLNVEDDLRR